MKDWPVPGGLLERLGRPAEVIEAKSRAWALAVAHRRWRHPLAEIAAAVIYAAGDMSLLELIDIHPRLLDQARLALKQPGEILVDVSMVEAGLHESIRQRCTVAVRSAGAASRARQDGTTRSAAGMMLQWPSHGHPSMVVIGNSPTALLAALDLSRAHSRPALIIATCPGFQIAAAAKQELINSKISYLTVLGSRGGSGLATAALNRLVEMADGD